MESEPLQPTQGKAPFEACMFNTVNPRIPLKVYPFVRQNNRTEPKARSKHAGTASLSPAMEKPQELKSKEGWNKRNNFQPHNFYVSLNNAIKRENSLKHKAKGQPM